MGLRKNKKKYGPQSPESKVKNILERLMIGMETGIIKPVTMIKYETTHRINDANAVNYLLKWGTITNADAVRFNNGEEVD